MWGCETGEFMGIPYYFKHVLGEHHHAIQNVRSEVLRAPVYFLMIDGNSIVYDAFRRLCEASPSSAVREDAILAETVRQMAVYVDLVRPTKGAMIAMDGVCPVAKMEQQRARRYKSWHDKRMAPYNNRTGTEGFDTVVITPGTAFMARLDAALYARFHGSNVAVSGSDQPGEGEHKLFAFLRANPCPDERVVLYGLDSDLIMLSLLACGPCCRTLFVMREAPAFAEQLVDRIHANELYAIDCAIFKEGLGDMPVEDYVFLWFFLGNDFLPHFPSANIRTTGITTLQTAYKEVGAPLIVRGEIHWPNVFQLAAFMAQHERALIGQELHARAQKAKRLGRSSDPAFVPLLDRRTESLLRPTAEAHEWSTTYYGALMGHAPSVAEGLAKKYVHALQWTWTYYTKGCGDWQSAYHDAYPPLWRDIAAYLCSPAWCPPVLRPSPALTTDMQLAYVFPRDALLRHHPNQEAAARCLAGAPEWYQENYPFQWAFCTYFWEAHVCMPRISVRRLRALVENQEKTCIQNASISAAVGSGGTGAAGSGGTGAAGSGGTGAAGSGGTGAAAGSTGSVESIAIASRNVRRKSSTSTPRA